MDSRVIAGARVAATLYRVPFPTILAVTQKESGGKVFAKVDGRDEPLVRWESHYFFRRLTGRIREAAVAKGLASQSVGGIPNPSSQEQRWKKLIRPAIALAEMPAYASFSTGVGQVMNANNEMCGFNTPKEIFEYQRKGATEQIDVMMRYCKAAGLIDDLQRGDFRGFTLGYNGAKAPSSYWKDIEALSKQYAKQYPDGPTLDGIPVDDPIKADKARRMVRYGSKGALVRDAQALLKRANFYTGKVDGDFQDLTDQAVRAFQAAQGWTGGDVDGKIGPKTWTALDEYRKTPDERPGDPDAVETITTTPEGQNGAKTTGGGISIIVIKEAIQEAIDAVSPSLGTSSTLDTVYVILTLVGTVLTIAGVLWAVYGWWKARNKTEGVLGA